MGDSFEHDLAQAFLIGHAPRSDLVEAAVARAEQSRVRRRTVLASGLLVGFAVAITMIAGAGLLGSFPTRGVLAEIAAWAARPLFAYVIGSTLLMAVAGRNLLRDI